MITLSRDVVHRRVFLWHRLRFAKGKLLRGGSLFAIPTTYKHKPWLGYLDVTWRRHDMETLSAILAFCEGNPSVTSGFLFTWGQWCWTNSTITRFKTAWRLWDTIVMISGRVVIDKQMNYTWLEILILLCKVTLRHKIKVLALLNYGMKVLRCVKFNGG